MVVPQGKYNYSEVAMLDYKSMMDTFFEKGDPKLLVDEINRRQKASHRGKGRRSSGKDHHPSVKIIPGTK